MSSFWERKTARIAKSQSSYDICVSCNGTGYYDDDGSPKCGACNGSGEVISRSVDELLSKSDNQVPSLPQRSP